MEGRRLNIKLFGRVQGVGLRYEVLKQAQRLNLNGWVVNLPDGSVQILAEGDESRLNLLKKWVKDEINFTEINKIEADWDEMSGEFNQFYIR